MKTTRRSAIQMMAGLTATVAVPGIARTAAANFYDDALIIDALCFGRDWGDDAFEALRLANYSGIFESLSRRDLQAAIDALVEWRTAVKEHPDKLMLALEAADFERAKETARTAVVMNFQDTIMLEGDVDNVDALHALGMRCCQLTYNFLNLVGDGCLERTNAGISDFGIEVVERMNDLGVMIDLSHCGRQTTLDGIEFSKKPVSMTHTMCVSVRGEHPRAKTDEQIPRRMPIILNMPFQLRESSRSVFRQIFHRRVLSPGRRMKNGMCRALIFSSPATNCDGRRGYRNSIHQTVTAILSPYSTGADGHKAIWNCCWGETGYGCFRTRSARLVPCG